MGDNGDAKKLHVVTIELAGAEGRIEKLRSKETGPGKIRISGWSLSHQRSHPLDISEKDLVILLQKAIRAGILSPEFLQDLHSEFEI